MTGSAWTQRLLRWPRRLSEYIQELQAEMRRVTWPNRKQVQATTAVVIAAVFAFAGYFAVVDLIFGRLITQIFNYFAK